MNASKETLNGHLANELLVRALDEELSGAERLQVEMHLADCAGCRENQADLRRVSDGFYSFLQASQQDRSSVDMAPSTGSVLARQTLANRLEDSKQREQSHGAGKTLARFGWVLAAAATIAIAISYVPFSRSLSHSGEETALMAKSHPSRQGSPFEVDGETFQYLPYSNPDLPLGGSHIVQMQVPLSSLADAGVLVEPTVNRMSMPDRSVLADVLLGLDGQPIGVHVLSAD